MLTAALTMLFLLGFMGVALDFGHLFVVKGELQNAMDSCALAAAEELDGQPDALTRARNAGIAAGNLNRVDFQSANWRGRGQIADASIVFRNAAYIETAVAADARYAQCEHAQAAVPMWLLQALGAFSGDAVATTQDVGARAVATRSSAQSVCVIPLALKPRPGGAAPDYGFTVGDWVTLIMQQNAAAGGEIGWANLDGSNNAAETVRQLERCERAVSVSDPLGTPGVQTAVAVAWNRRFGIYRNVDQPSEFPPDLTGYAYTAQNWPRGRDAYSGDPGAGAHASAANYVDKRQAFASCANTGTRVRGANSCESITGLDLNSFQHLAAPGNVPGGHRQYGRNRRIVTVPVVDAGSRVIDFACMLMLQPLSIPMTNVQLEFLGNAGAVGSPCTTSGVPGGVAGPLVPVLVQ